MFRNCLVLTLVTLAGSSLQAQTTPPKPNADAVPPDEPIAETFSLEKSVEYLDKVSLKWTEERKCGSCHTTYAYLMARPALSDKPSPAMTEIRKFFEHRVANWDTAKPRWDTEVVATAAALAFNDAKTTGRLQPLTRQALDRMWKLQQPDGAWKWLKCNWPPMEHDDYFGAVYAALGVGVAPDGYAQNESAKEGLAKLRRYFEKTAAPDLHHRTMLLWASLYLDGLMTKEQRQATIDQLLALQRSDGGWNLPSLGNYKRHDGTPNDKDARSDGYATGFVVYVLRQAGVPTNHEKIRRSIAWLKGNQRISGQWFTRSLSNDAYHFISHAGTAFAVMALKSCDGDN